MTNNSSGMISVDLSDELVHPREADRMLGAGQSCLVVRFGGIGDTLFVTPVLRLFREMGFDVSAYTTRQFGLPALLNNPHVKQIYTKGDVPWDAEMFQDIQKYFHKVVNLQGNLEDTLCFTPEASPERYYANHWQRQTRTDYMEAALTAAGLRGAGSKLLFPEIYLDDVERGYVNRWVGDHEDRGEVPVLWLPVGSSINKHILQSPSMIRWALETFPQIHVYLVGDGVLQSHVTLAKPLCDIVNEYPKRVTFAAGRWKLRKALILVGRCGLFVGPETGLAVAKGAGKAPGIIFWSASAPYNVSRSWFNTYSIPTSAPCSPCYRVPTDYRKSPECTVVGPNGEFTGAFCANGIDQEAFEAAFHSVMSGRADRTCPFCASRDFREVEGPWSRCQCHSVFESTTSKRARQPFESPENVEEMFNPLVLGRTAHMTRSVLETAEELRGEKGTFLDVGCGAGVSVKTAQSLGWLAAGIDHHPNLPDAQGVMRANFLAADVASHDVVWLCHVLHATDDPCAMLQKAITLLSPSGVLLITTPDTDAVDLSHYLSWSTAKAFPSMHWLVRRLQEVGFEVPTITVNSGLRENGFPYRNDFTLIARKAITAISPVNVPVGGQEVATCSV